jgi:Mg2+-importing ATPase
MTAPAAVEPIWSLPLPELFQRLEAGPEGLGNEEALRRLQRHGPNRLHQGTRSGTALVLLRQFTSPIILILTAAALLSFVLDSPTDVLIILAIVLVSGLLGFWQENGAAHAVQQLLRCVETTATVWRDGVEQPIARDQLVPGDVLVLAAGAGIPADCRVLEERDLSLDEAALTGESFPVSKHPIAVAPGAPLSQRSNVLFLGTHVVSGTGRAMVVHTGAATAFGEIAERLRSRSAPTEFESGVRRFGMLLLELTLVLVFAIFAINVYLQRPIVDSFLFSLALGVGLTPQLLPAIISVNLARGARRMAAQQVIVKRLAAIENFGSMSILCSDKTGTLTEGAPWVRRCCGVEGRSSERVMLHALINASFETGFPNAVDDGIRRSGAESAAVGELQHWTKLDELPFDFLRKRQSILARCDGMPVLITKGALSKVLDVCTQAELEDGSTVPLETVQGGRIRALYASWSGEGDRVLGVAIRPWQATGVEVPRSVTREDEAGMTFLGLVALSDPLRSDAARTVADLKRMGCS